MVNLEQTKLAYKEAAAITSYCKTLKIDPVAKEALKQVNTLKRCNPNKSLEELIPEKTPIVMSLVYLAMRWNKNSRNIQEADYKLRSDPSYREEISKKLKEIRPYLSY